MSKSRKKKRGVQAKLASDAAVPPVGEPPIDEPPEIEPAKPVPTPEPQPGLAGRIVPWAVFGLCLLVFALKPVVSPPKVKEGFDYHAFGKLPVLLGGRIKPMDTVARTSLLQIAGEQRIALEGNGPSVYRTDSWDYYVEANGSEVLFNLDQPWGERQNLAKTAEGKKAIQKIQSNKDRWLYVVFDDGARSLFDLNKDPHLEKNLWDKNDKTIAELVKQFSVKKTWGSLDALNQTYGGKSLKYRRFYQFNKRPKKLHPTQWLLEVLMEPDVADRRFIFRIDHPELLSELQLAEVGVDKSGLRFYSFKQMQPYVLLLHKKKQVIGQKDAATRTPYERAAFKLAHALELYIQLRYSLQPNFLALGDKSDRSSGFANYEQTLEQMRASAEVVSAYIKKQRAGKQDDDPWPHIYAALEWLPKPQSDLEKWEQKDHAFVRAAEREAVMLGKIFFELDRSGGFNRDNLAPGRETNLVEEVRQSLGVLQERQRGNPDFASLDHVINDFFSVDAEAQAVFARYLILTEGPLQTMKDRSSLLMIPPAKRTDYAEGWVKVAEASIHNLGAKQKPSEPERLYAVMSGAFDSQITGTNKNGNVKDFNQAVADLGKWMHQQGYVTEVKKGREEHFFNTFAPFARAQGLYIIALLLACFSWLKMSRGLTNTAFYLIGLAFVLHTVGLIFRMYLEGRPPVTNLYSSAVFVGWGAVLLGWILERIYRNGIGSCVAALVGFSTLIIASHLAKEGDTMEMMRAVLDTNFWLATHVVCITIGYSATFLAGFLAIVYVLRGVFTPSLEKDTGKSLARMAYGIICFATFFSFVGTVLGGIWADQSWGRFWGWDSKENGALMIVVWNAIILHCRWGGFVKDRGLMSLAIFGNIVTAWSWFGVNMLGIGLHSYGFMDSAFHTLQWFGISQLLLILAAAQPVRHWLSGSALSGERNLIIATIGAAVMGLGLALHILSFWTSDFLMYLGVALVGAGFVLSLLPASLTGTTTTKPAA